MKKYTLLLVAILVMSLAFAIQPASSQNQCIPNWQCSDWTTCANSQTTRSCVDTNNCNTAFHPPEIKSCTPQKTCEYDWQPTEWFPSCDTQCTQTRTYVNKGTCQGTSGKPPTDTRLFTPTCKDSDYTLELSRTSCSSQGELLVTLKANKICVGDNTITKKESCTPTCQSSDFNYSEWSVCSQDGKKTRSYTKKISCNGEPSKSDLEATCKPLCLLSDFVFTEGECQANGYKQISWIKSSTNDCEFSEKDGKLYTGNVVLANSQESCNYTKSCDVGDWQQSSLSVSCGEKCENVWTWEAVSCSGEFGKPSNELKLHQESIRKKGYFLDSIEITDKTAAIAMGNAVLVPGGKSGEVLVDYMKLVVKDASGKETVIAEDSFSSGTTPYGGAWAIVNWFKNKTNNQSIFSVKDGSLVAPVSKYPNDVLHPWGTQWPRVVIPAGSKSIEMRARVKATGDASWQWGLDFYENSTTEFPIAEGGISDWYFTEHDWVDVVVGPVHLTIPTCKDSDYSLESSGDCQPDGTLAQTYTKTGFCEGEQKITKDIVCNYVRLCTQDDWEHAIIPSQCPVDEKQTKTYSKKPGVICDGQKPTDEIISCVNPPPKTSVIPNQLWDEDTTKIIDLTKYFSDTGSLTFVASFIKNIAVQISDGIAKLIPKTDFSGNGTVIFTATNDKGKSVSSNEIMLNIHPLAETEGSIILSSEVSEDSSVLLSSVKSSVIEKSSVDLSSSDGSSIRYANVFNSEIIESDILNSKVTDSFVDPSQIIGSDVSLSDIIDSIVIDSTITHSTITNMKVTNAVVGDNFLKSGSIEFEGNLFSGPISLWEIQNPVLNSGNVFIQGDNLVVNFMGLTVSNIKSDSESDCSNKAGSYSSTHGLKFNLSEGKPRLVGSFNGWSTEDAIVGTVNGDQFIFDVKSQNLPDGDYAFYIKYGSEGPSCLGQWFYVKQSHEGLIRNVNGTYSIVVKISNSIPSISTNTPTLRTENVMKDWLDGSDLVMQGNKLIVKYSDKRIWYKDGLETKYDPKGSVYFTGYFDGWQKLLPATVEPNDDIVLDVSSYPVGSIFAGGFVSSDNYWMGLSNNDPENIRVEGNSIYLVFEKTVNGIAKTIKQVDKTNQFLANKYWIDDNRIKINGQKLEIEASSNTFYKDNQEFVPNSLSGKQYFAAGPFDNWMRSRSLSLSGTKLIFDLTNEKSGVYAFAVQTSNDEWLGMADKNQDFVRTEIEQDGNKSYWIVVEKKVFNGVPGLYQFTGSKIPREAFVFDIPYTNQPTFVPQEDRQISKKNIEYNGDLLFTIHFPDKVLFGNPGSEKPLGTMERSFYYAGEYDGWKNWVPITKNDRSITMNFNGFPDGIYYGTIRTDQNEWLWVDSYSTPFAKSGVNDSAGNLGYYLVIVKEGNQLKPFDGPGSSIQAQYNWIKTKPPTANPDPIRYDLLNSYHAHLDNGELIVKEWKDNKVSYIKDGKEYKGVPFKDIQGNFVLKIGYSTSFWSPLEIQGRISGDKIIFNLRAESLPNGDYPINLVFRGSDGSEQWFWVQDSESRIVKNFDYHRLAIRVAGDGGIVYADGALNLDANKIKNLLPIVVQAPSGGSVVSAPITLTRDSLNTDYDFFKWAVFGVFTSDQISSFKYVNQGDFSGEDAIKAYWEFAKTTSHLGTKYLLDSVWEARKYDTGYFGQKSYKGSSCTVESLFNDYEFFKWAYETKNGVISNYQGLVGEEAMKAYWEKYSNPNHPDWVGRGGVHFTVLDNMLKLWNPVSQRLSEYPSTCVDGSITPSQENAKVLVWTSDIKSPQTEVLGTVTVSGLFGGEVLGNWWKTEEEIAWEEVVKNIIFSKPFPKIDQSNIVPPDGLDFDKLSIEKGISILDRKQKNSVGMHPSLKYVQADNTQYFIGVGGVVYQVGSGGIKNFESWASDDSKFDKKLFPEVWSNYIFISDEKLNPETKWTETELVNVETSEMAKIYHPSSLWNNPNQKPFFIKGNALKLYDAFKDEIGFPVIVENMAPDVTIIRSGNGRIEYRYNPYEKYLSARVYIPSRNIDVKITEDKSFLGKLSSLSEAWLEGPVFDTFVASTAAVELVLGIEAMAAMQISQIRFFKGELEKITGTMSSTGNKLQAEIEKAFPGGKKANINIKSVDSAWNKFLNRDKEVNDWIRGRKIVTREELESISPTTLKSRGLKVVENTFDDYVSNPKPSGYMAKHIHVEIDGKMRGEIQFTTAEIERVAEFEKRIGAYAGGKNSQNIQIRDIVKNLFGNANDKGFGKSIAKPIEVPGTESQARKTFEIISEGGRDITEAVKKGGYVGEKMFEMFDGSRIGFRIETSGGRIPTIDMHNFPELGNLKIHFY